MRRLYEARLAAGAAHRERRCGAVGMRLRIARFGCQVAGRAVRERDKVTGSSNSQAYFEDL